ncbi:hypothetical protein TUBRATIS_25760 [Tubulinosema ratisbonensis]|uniref:Uncharacterized protein n=1 Tax=Tubulinosema ratisbonensis TaxID=291195 RepID=A0A437AIS5_9MICR|nr:hypothetical protein TUBRATIS_25760 [Tubulinosema ratisbonensis]
MTKLNFPNFNNYSNNDTKSYKEIKIKRISRKTSNENSNVSFTKNNNDPIMKKLTAERKSRLKMLKDNPDSDVLEITKDCITALNQYLDSFQEGVENLSNKDDFENIINGLDDDLDGIFDYFDDLNGDIRMMMDFLKNFIRN